MTWSIRARLTLWCSALMVTTLAAFGVGVLWLHARWVHAQFDAELAGLGAATARTMDEELRESGILRKAAHEAGSSMDVPGRATAILDRGRTAARRPMARLSVQPRRTPDGRRSRNAFRHSG